MGEPLKVVGVDAEGVVEAEVIRFKTRDRIELIEIPEKVGFAFELCEYKHRAVRLYRSVLPLVPDVRSRVALRALAHPRPAGLVVGGLGGVGDETREEGGEACGFGEGFRSGLDRTSRGVGGVEGFGQ